MNSAPDRPTAASDPGRGRRIGVDVGTVRVGVAVSDPDAILATPVETVTRSGDDTQCLARIAEIVLEYQAVEVVVGLPRTLRGQTGVSAQRAIEFANSLRASLPALAIRLSDERLTTVAATRALRDSGVRAREQRRTIDQAAAVAILQGWLDERSAALRCAGGPGGGGRT